MNKQYTVTCCFNICLILLCFFVNGFQTVQGETQFRFERLWPKLQQPWYFFGPTDIATDNAGFVYIADTDNNRIQVFTSNGIFVRTIGKLGKQVGEFSKPRSITISSNGLLFVADTANHRIQVFTVEGVFVRSWGEEGQAVQQLSFPSGVAVADNGLVYVADSKNNRIQVFNEAGEYIRHWGTMGNADGQFNKPTDLVLTPDRQVYVVDTNNHRVSVFSEQGQFIRNIGQLGTKDGEFEAPTSISYSPHNDQIYVASQGSTIVFAGSKLQVFSRAGQFIKRIGKDSSFNGLYGVTLNLEGDIYVTEQFSPRVQVMSSTGQTLQFWQAFGKENNNFLNPTGITNDQNGNIYIADTGNARIQIFNKTGKFETSWGRWGSDFSVGNNNMQGPNYIAIANDELYITDTYANKILVYSASGKIARSWGNEGSANGQFRSPAGIAIAGNGHVYIADSNNQRIQVFSSAGAFLFSWGGLGKEKGQFAKPVGITISPDNEVYVTDTEFPSDSTDFFENQRVQVFNLQGQFLRQFGGPGSNDEQLRHPRDVKLGTDGLVYVSDSGNDRIHVFSAQGEYRYAIGGLGTGQAQFVVPKGLAMTSDSMYVVDSENARIQVFTKNNPNISAEHPFKAIVLAGGGPSQGDYINHIWNETQLLSNRAYNALRTQGFAKQEIKYLSSTTTMDLDNNGLFDDLEVATLANLQAAISSWAIDAQDVVLYFIDHGGPGKFQVNAAEILTAEQLKLWLGQLSDAIPGKITLIIESCRSGSFIPSLAQNKRFIISSSDADQAAVISNKGFNAFSYYFWNEITAGALLKDAFQIARQSMSRQIIQGRSQNAQLDANGDSVFDGSDPSALGDYCLGNCTRFAANPPRILSATPDKTLQGESSVNLTIQTQSLNTQLNAWAVVVRPDYQHPNIDEPIADLPVVPLRCDELGQCKGNYQPFNVTGNYQFNFYVQDNQYQLSPPRTVNIRQTRSDTAVYDDQHAILTLNEVFASGQHYRVELLDQGHFQFTIHALEPLVSAIGNNIAVYDEQQLTVVIPRVRAFEHNYAVIMQHTGDFIFRLLSVKHLPD